MEYDDEIISKFIHSRRANINSITITNKFYTPTMVCVNYSYEYNSAIFKFYEANVYYSFVDLDEFIKNNRDLSIQNIIN